MRTSLVIASLLLPLPLAAQWSAALLVGGSSIRGDAINSLDGDRPELRPNGLTAVELLLRRRQGSWRFGADVSRGSADLVEASAGTTVSTNAAFRAWQLGLEASARAVGVAGRTSVYLGIGVGASRWSFRIGDSSPRTRTWGRATMELDMPLGPAWALLLRSELAIGPSVFAQDELPDGFARTAQHSLGLLIGLERSFAAPE